MARVLGPAAIDEVLRRRRATIDHLQEAFRLMPGRVGNTRLAEFLHDSRESPWSHLERDAHARLRAAGIRRWKSNHRIRSVIGVHFIDVAFPGPKLAVELDGWEFHSSRVSFIQDRRRDAALVALGWTVLHFTAESMDDLVPRVREALRRRAA